VEQRRQIGQVLQLFRQITSAGESALESVEAIIILHREDAVLVRIASRPAYQRVGSIQFVAAGVRFSAVDHSQLL